MKKRADLLLVEKGLVSTRQKAQRLIMAGKVLAEDEPVLKAGQLISVEAVLKVKNPEHEYVSRGALKLVQALNEFNIQIENKTALDIGSSTGGFTEVLLQRGARQVFAVDAGTNQMDWKLRSDPRVVLFEKTNARYMNFELIGKTVDVVTLDVSFISLEKIFPNIIQFVHPQTDWISLIKPQFEVGRDEVGKGGIVTNLKAREAVVQRIQSSSSKIGLHLVRCIDCTTHGADGNQEFLAHWKMSG